MDERDYSLSALNKFMDYASTKGLLNQNTGNSRKQAANKILSVLDENETKDLRKIDIEQTFSRFTNLQGKEFKPTSLQVFQSRLKTALMDFFAYVENPTISRLPSTSRSKSNATSNANGATKLARRRRRNTNKSDKSEELRSKDNANGSPANQLTIPVPLRVGLTVMIDNIPADLSSREAEKLAAIVRAYAVPEE